MPTEEALYQEALGLLAVSGVTSRTILQRRLRVNFHAATRLIERLQAEGHVGAANENGAHFADQGDNAH